MQLGLFVGVFFIFAFLIGIMAVGVMMGRRPITGSCGGIGRVSGEDSECAICGGDPVKCEEAINSKSVVGTVSPRPTPREAPRSEGPSEGESRA